MIYSPIGQSRQFLQAALAYWYFLFTSASKPFLPCLHCSNQVFLLFYHIYTKHRSRRKAKRKFYGNRHTIQPQFDSSNMSETESPTTSASTDTDRQVVPDGNVDNDNSTSGIPASQMKLANTDWSDFGENTSNFGIFDISILCSVINSCAMCSVCKCGHLCLTENSQVKMGLSRQFILACNDESCDFEVKFFSSQRCRGSRAFEVNRRFVAGMRTVGAGFSDMETLCGILNMPPAMMPNAYADTLHDIADATHLVAQESMQNAAKELHEKAHVDEDDVLGIDCMFDGSWQKRGHSSLIGYVAAISPDTRKCLDIELLSKICKGCASKAHLDKESTEYLSWYAGHYKKCGLTYGGSSPSVEPAGAVRIYERSVESLHLQ